MSDSGPQDDPPPTVSQLPIVIPPHTTVYTRKQTSPYGKLASGKTKEELLSHPIIYSSINTADQAKKHLLERLLVQVNQDPDHSMLNLALLNIIYTALGITAIAANAICSVAILINTLPSHLSASTTTQQTLIPPQLKTLTDDLKAQVTSLVMCIANVRETIEVNKAAAVTLTRTINVARNDLHNTAQVVNNLVKELSDIPSQIKDAILTMASPASPPPPHHGTHNSPYRDALIQEPRVTTATPPAPSSCPDGTRANAAIKERQILLDIDPDHPSLNGETPRSEMINMIQKALMSLQEISSPSFKIKALIQLRNGGFVVELSTPEAATWVRDPTRKLILIESLGGNVCMKDRTYNLLIPFVPISTRINKSIWCSIEQGNEIPCNSITQMKWIKDPSRRKGNQRVAHALMSLNSPKAANRLISKGIYYNQGKLCARKDKREPLSCLKCQ